MTEEEKLKNLLVVGFQLINRSINNISHGKPTVAEGQKFLDDVIALVPDFTERIVKNT